MIEPCKNKYCPYNEDICSGWVCPKIHDIAGRLNCKGYRHIPFIGIEWVSVKDMLPCKSDDVLLWNGSNREIYLCYEREHFEAYYKDITHWMPLPAPPTGDLT